MMDNDANLIQRTLEGDQQAFAELVEKYQKQVHTLAWQKIGDFHIAQEIAQDTFLTAYHKLKTLKDPNRFAGWLYVIANRKCIAWHRKKSSQPQSLDAMNPIELEEVYYSVYMTQQREEAVNQKRREVVQKLLSKLQESERTVVNLYYIAEMTCEDIGKFLGVSPNTVRSRLHRARNRLRKEETMIKENLSSFQLPTQLTENIMKEISHISPAAPSGSKPLLPWAIAASSAILIMLMLGMSGQYLARFQKPYSLDAQTDMMVELVDTPIVLNLEVEPDVQNQLGGPNVRGESNNRGEKPDAVLLAAAQAQGEDVSVSEQQWIQSEPISGDTVWRLLATPEEELYVLDPLARLYKLAADGKEWKRIFDGRLLKTSWSANPPIAKWKNTLYIVSSGELFASHNDGKTWNLVHSFPEVFGPIDLVLTDQGFYVAFRDWIFRSEDKGKTWKAMDNRLGFIREIRSLVEIQGTLFAMTSHGLYRFKDDNWQRLEFPVFVRDIESVAVTEEKLYVAVLFHGNVQKRRWGIFRSTDLGDTWDDITPTNAWPEKGQSPNITLVAAGETLLAMERGMVRSTDGGDTWMPPQTSGTSPMMVLSVLLPTAALNDRVFYVGGWDGLHRSTDGGKSWDKVNITSDLDRGRIDNLIVYQKSNKGPDMLPTLYARFEGMYMRWGGEIAKTTDMGKSWKTIQMDIPITAPNREGQPSISQIVESAGVIYAKNEYSQGSGNKLLYRVSADGKTLVPIQGMPDIDSRSLGEQLLLQKIPAALPSTIIPIEQWQEHFAGAAQFFKQLILLQQGDQMMELRRGGLRGPFAISGDTFYMEYNFKLFRWKRGGTEWSDTGQEETVELTPDIAKIDLKLAVSGNIVYVGKRDGHLVVSFDKGNNWIDITQGLPFTVNTFNDIVVAGSTVYVATDAGIITSDDGRNWRTITDVEGTNLIMEHLAVDGTMLYGVTKGTGIHRLESSTWEQVVAENPDNVTSLAVDENMLYVGTKSKGMLYYNLKE